MNPVATDILMHYGMPRRSGRYPWGSGKNPYQHSADFMARVKELQKDGKSQVEIAEDMGLTTTQLRIQMSLAKDERRALQVDRAKSLRADGKSLNEIARIMGFKNDSSVRSLLNESSEARMNVAKNTADYLKKLCDEKGMIDVGAGQERELNCSKEKLNEALYMLYLQGYEIYGVGAPQVTNKGKQTNLKVLCPPGTPHSEAYNFDKIHYIREYDKVLDEDGNERKRFEYPESLDSKRLQVVYGDQGGLAKDGLVEIRPGVKDLNMGDAHYAQVRIMVDGTHYIKGMAVYNEDLPPGVDVRFNVKYDSGTPIKGEKGNTVLKPIKKDDPNNPFGSLIKEDGGQSYYDDPNGKYKDKNGVRQSLSLINKRAEEGDWGDWSDHLPSQFLSKQPMKLINQQLNLTKTEKYQEFEEISNLTNPTLKRHLLDAFANDCDSAAVHLQAAALPRQKYQVILPIKNIRDNEVYAPNFNDGETVALVRFPHEGRHQIAVCTVNNKNKEGQKFIGKNPKDAVGVSAATALKMSGADFDGDTVMVIPINDKIQIKSQALTGPFKELEGFDTELYYGGKKDGTYKKMSKGATQIEMGKISNLITDMTLKGADANEIVRATKHSMVVIDAEKHGLDYKQSEKDNGIAALKKKYQGHYNEKGEYHEGASTIISLAKSEQSVPKRKGSPKVDTETGELIWKTAPDKELYYEEAKKVKVKDERGRNVKDEKGKQVYLQDENGKFVYEKTGKTKMRTQKSTKMAETKDAYSLVSDFDTPQERAYADYANYMKSLGNQARKEMISTPRLKYNATAHKTYEQEVSHLMAQLNEAEKNAPRERRAQLMANTIVKAKKQDNPDMTSGEEKKIAQNALTESRKKTGAHRKTIDISDKEWEAIQAGAISDTQLANIFKYTDLDKLRERATPRNNGALTQAKQSRIKAMASVGYTNAEIAKALGISSSTVTKYL